MSSVFASAVDLLNGPLQYFSSHHLMFVRQGLKFLSLSLIVACLIALFTWWLEGGVERLIATLLRIALITVIPLTMMQNWEQTTGEITGFFQDELVQTILQESGMEEGGGDGVEVIKGLITNISNSVWGDSKNAGVSVPKTTWEKTREFLSDPAGAVGGAIFSGMTDLVLRVMVMAVSIVLMLSITVSMYVPLFMMQLGIVIGPLLLGFFPYSPMSYLASNWLKFMAGMGASVVISVLMTMACAASIDTFVTNLALLGSDQSLNWGEELVAKFSTFLGAAVAILTIAIMILSSSKIAFGLLSGSSADSDLGVVLINQIKRFNNGKSGKSTTKPPTK